MDTAFTIRNQQPASELRIHPQAATVLGLGERKFTHVSFGTQKHYLPIRRDADFASGQIGLSRKLIQTLYLPDYLHYELRFNPNGNELAIGPYIGLLMSKNGRNLTAANLQRKVAYVKCYPKLHGAVVVFALDTVDQSRRLVEGYCYHPADHQWQKGIFPYPAAIYRTIGLNSQWKSHFAATIGDKFFNNRFFNKWQMYQWFANEPALRPFLPETRLYQSPQDLLELLEQYQTIYIKPILGLRGRGIARVAKGINRQLLMEYRQKNVNHSQAFADPDQAWHFFAQRYQSRRYVIQPAVDLLRYQGRLLDFRCILQKNHCGDWVCQAVIGRVGVKNSVVSNISSGGSAYIGASILRKTLNLSEDRLNALLQRMTDLALLVCGKLNDYGFNLGTLGLDIGIDTQLRLWLIEINNRDPDPGIALDINDQKLFQTLQTTPLFYAKYLAGFTETL